MGGDDWSFLDEECAKLEKKGGKKGGARGGRRGGQGDGGHRRATDDGLKNNDGKVDEGAGLDEWSALDDELARMETAVAMTARPRRETPLTPTQTIVQVQDSAAFNTLSHGCLCCGRTLVVLRKTQSLL